MSCPDYDFKDPWEDGYDSGEKEARAACQKEIDALKERMGNLAKEGLDRLVARDKRIRDLELENECLNDRICDLEEEAAEMRAEHSTVVERLQEYIPHFKMSCPELRGTDDEESDQGGPK